MSFSILDSFRYASTSSSNVDELVLPPSVKTRFENSFLLSKIGFSLNHCKCIDHTSNKVDFISPNIIPIGID